VRKIIYLMMVSLDGFVEGPNRELDCPSSTRNCTRLSTISKCDRHLPVRTADVPAHGSRLAAGRDGPSMPGYMVEFSRIWKAMPKVVFSKTLDRVEWNSRLVRGNNIAAEVAKLKAQPGKDMSVGGANLASTFIRLGLIDEYRIFIHPVIVGGGTPYFTALDDVLTLKLVDTRTFGSGVVYLRYQPAAGRGRPCACPWAATRAALHPKNIPK